MKQRYMSFGVMNPLQMVYSVRDSLQLTDTQRLRLEHAVRAFEARLDTVWSPLANELATADTVYDRTVALSSVRRAQDSAWDALEQAVGAVRSILTGYQIELIDPAIAALLDPAAIARLRRTEFRF